ncbi:MAG: hypothetical protein KJO98_06840 [Rhodothermia bacterium]|nr:hypothetical protein [Rhodothermia bacterium]
MNTFSGTRSSIAVLAILSLASLSCLPEAEHRIPVSAASTTPDQFGDYWYQGEAEITSYDLEQARYGALRSGSAVTIFVTEDFSRQQQVKLDNPARAGNDAVKVLKLNSMRKFNTGIYPYSTMTSVFTPVYRSEDPHTVKTTASIQEWCGQTFVQLNRQADGYRIKHFSYFESEGDGEESVGDVVLEDEIWNLVRLSPQDLPQGSITVLPSVLHQRLSHDDWGPQEALGELGPVINSDSLMEYRLTYEDIPRTLTIHFSTDFPHEIQYWEEHHVSGFGPNAEELVTRGTLRERLMIDYWTRNRPGDEVLREELGLPIS